MLDGLIEKVKQDFIRQFRVAPLIVITAPGRINLIGEHTDYNNGLVLPAAINRYAVFAVNFNGLGRHRICATDLDDMIDIPLKQYKKSVKSWANYLIGILKELDVMTTLTGIDCLFSCNIPMGAGMSSSSAIECGFIKSICESHKVDLSRREMIHISQKSNHKFLEIGGGTMDQFACLFGKADHAIYLDCQTDEHSYIPAQLENHQFILLDTKITHDHTTSKYNDRVAECKDVINTLAKKYPHLKTLRDVDEVMLQTNAHLLHPIALNRAKFVLGENRRVQLFVNALRERDIELMGSLLTTSHVGLQRQYEVSCSELDLLVDLALSQPGVVGTRMMGGGFGGCTINLVEKSKAEIIAQNLLVAYKEKTGIEGAVHFVDLVDGVATLAQ